MNNPRFLSHWIRTTLSVCGLLGAHCVVAAPVGVTATINPGTACTPSLNTTALDYGDIDTSALSQDKPTALPAKPLTLNVACAPLASKFFFRIIDRISAPRPEEDLGPAAGVPDSDFILGLRMGAVPNQPPLGEVFLKSTTVLADAKRSIILHSNGGGGSHASGDFEWQERRSEFFWGGRGGLRRYAVADPVSQLITSARHFTIQMEAIPVISAHAVDGLTNDARIDSKFTIEITQL